MKKMILAVALLLTGIVSAQADGREKPITYNPQIQMFDGF